MLKKESFNLYQVLIILMQTFLLFFVRPAIEIAAETNAGAFYAVQSLKSLSDCDKLHQTLLPTGEILVSQKK